MLQPRREDAFLSLSDQIIASIAEAFDEADWPDGRNSTGGSTPDRRPCWLELSEWDLDEERVWEYNASSVYELPAHMAASLRAPWFRYSGVIRFLYPEPPNSDGRVYRNPTGGRLWASVFAEWDRFVRGLTDRQRKAISRWLQHMSAVDREKWNDYAAHGTHLDLCLSNFWGQFLDPSPTSEESGMTP